MQINHECDILIVGAGPAGLSAAITAAKKNQRVILMEKNRFLGGTIVTAHLNAICGLYPNSSSEPAQTLNAGLVREIINKLKTKKISRKGKVYVLEIEPDELITAFQSFIKNNENIEVLYGTKAEAVNYQKKRITNINDIKAKTIIDCSGDGTVLKLTDSYQSDPLDSQLSGYTFALKGLTDSDESLNIKTAYSIERAISDNRLPSYLRNTTFTLTGKNSGSCRFNTKKGTVSDDKLYKEAEKTHSYLIENLPEFKDSYIDKKQMLLTNREGLRLKGNYTLTEKDVLGARKFKSGGVKNAWPIELWNEGGCEYQYLKPGEFYEIPYQCLQSSDLNNLYAAGRCISATQRALGSARVIGPCISLGENAALLAVKNTDENTVS